MSTRGHWIRKPFTKDNNKTISSVSFNVTYSIICIKDSLMSKYDQLIMFYGIIRHDASYFHTMIVGIILELNNIAKKVVNEISNLYEHRHTLITIVRYCPHAHCTG